MPKANRYQGVVVPMLSPFTAAGTIDEPAVGRIVDVLVGGGVAGVFPLGTTGESASIPIDEKRKLVAATVKATKGRAMVYAGIAANCYKESIDGAKAYKEFGVDAIVAHMPSYYPLNDQEIESYFLKLADAVELPLVLYNIPVTTYHSIPLKSIPKLSKHPNIVAIKDSAGDPERITQLLKETGGKEGFPVLLGNSALYAHGLKLGGVGLVPSGAHVVPDLYQAMFEAGMAEKWDRVGQLQKETDAAVSGYLKGRSIGQGLAVLKAVMEKRGICSRHMLPPLNDFVGAV